MNAQFEAAWRLHLFFTRHAIPYVVIGRLAVQRWGQPRLTRDVDVTVLLSPGREEHSGAPEVTARFERIWAGRDADP